MKSHAVFEIGECRSGLVQLSGLLQSYDLVLTNTEVQADADDIAIIDEQHEEEL